MQKENIARRRFFEHLQNALRTQPNATPQCNTINMSLPTIHVHINAIPTWALIDTGATHCYINSTLVPEHIPRSRSRAHVAAQVAHLNIQGSTKVNLQIGKSKHTIQCYVADNFNHPFILGGTWLRRQAVHINYVRNCLNFGRHQRHTAFWKRTNPTPKPSLDTAPVKVTHGFPAHLQERYRNLLKTLQDVQSHEKRAIVEQVEEMVAKGVIEPSSSPYSSPLGHKTRQHIPVLHGLLPVERCHNTGVHHNAGYP